MAFGKEKSVDYSGIVCPIEKTSYEIIIPDSASSELAALNDEGMIPGRQVKKNGSEVLRSARWDFSLNAGQILINLVSYAAGS